MNTRLRAAVLASALLSGCASYTPRPLDPGKTAAALTRRNLSDPRLLRFLTTEQHRNGPPQWNLDTLALVAVYERPDMSVAKARLREAQGGETTAAALPNPTLSIAPTYDTTVTSSPWTVGPIVSFLIQSYGARPARIARARARTEEAQEAIAVTAWQLRAQVRTAMLDAWATQQNAALAARRAALAGSYRQAVDQRYQAGMVSAATLTMATLAQNQAELQFASDQRAVRLARAGLAAALGLPKAALDGIDLDMNGIAHPRQPGSLKPLVHAALTARPDVLAALAHYAAAQASLRLAVARQYPAIDIGPGYHYDQGDNKFILSISLPLPIFNQDQGPIAQARAARQIAAQQFLTTQAKALAEIDRAQTDWHASEAELVSAQKLREAAADALDRQRSAFTAGQIGRLRLLGAELAYVQSQQGTLTASVHERVALGHLEVALYHPFLVANRSQ
ncbi:TolC family protein [Pandoraea sp.]|uniref:TolC family protein n=1 Tax=Pandoraea sp. TaxID=1883445 RepID=UPI001227B929|nr:TolC family protein [Pandoraea sp.]TAL52740.1 MAG: TolC family protein [Pandoraea sp.]TAM17737.1 MAG: TolC family protein [Pandoraea sp.]